MKPYYQDDLVTAREWWDGLSDDERFDAWQTAMSDAANAIVPDAAKLKEGIATLILELAVSHRRERRVTDAAVMLAKSNVPSHPEDRYGRYDARRWIYAHDSLLKVLGWTRSDLCDVGPETDDPA